MVELVDSVDLGSTAKSVQVRVLLPAPRQAAIFLRKSPPALFSSLFPFHYSLFSPPYRPPAMRCRSGGMPPLLHSCSILPTAPHPVPSGPHSRGMTATGSHGYFHSLCGARPYTGEAFPQKNQLPASEEIFNPSFSLLFSLFSLHSKTPRPMRWVPHGPMVFQIKLSSSGAG